LKYKEPRALEALEQFIGGGYKSYEEDEEIPRNLEGAEYWIKFAQNTQRDFVREIDHIFYHYGMEKHVPAPYRYMLIGGVVVMPIFLVFALLCCFSDSTEEEIAPRRTVS